MKVVFRTDASMQIGSGHLMRCLTLADGLRDKGAEVRFFCRDLPGNLNRLIEENDFNLTCLPAPEDDKEVLDWNRHAPWLGVDWRQDADETLACLQAFDEPVDWLVVDHYALDRQWETLMRPMVGKIMVIDDLADRQHDCDLLLDQNLYFNQEKRYVELVPQKCQQLLGPTFSLLRPEFSIIRQSHTSRVVKFERVLIFMGGADTNNVAVKVLDALESLQCRELFIDFVVGAQTPHYKALRSKNYAFCKVNWHEGVNNMAALMAKADFAIGGGGTTVWERACLGLPSIVLAIADNQVPVAEAMAERGCCLYLGPAFDVAASDIAHAVSTIIKSPTLRRHFSQASQKVVDGRGRERVLKCLAEPVIQMREVNGGDCESVFEWRNAPEVRRYFFDPSPINWLEHKAWFESLLNNPARVLLIGEVAGQPVGVVRYDISGQEATISVYLVPGRLGQGVGPTLLRYADHWLSCHYPEIKRVTAEVLPDNIASRHAFEAAGYVMQHSVYYHELVSGSDSF